MGTPSPVFPQWSGGARISIVHKSGTLETL
jgi:hypothetical protein